MAAEAERKRLYSLEKFNTCDHAGVNLRIEVNRLEDTKATLGFCSHEMKWIEVNPFCRICLRHTKKKKKNYKKTPTQRQRISQGRLRQKQRNLESARYKPYNPFVEKDRSKDHPTKHDV